MLMFDNQDSFGQTENNETEGAVYSNDQDHEQKIKQKFCNSKFYTQDHSR